jgi:hypothetical protein
MTSTELRPVDPFGFWPGRASKLIDRSDVASMLESAPQDYAFHTPYIFQSPGPFLFEGAFQDLDVARGDLILRIHALDIDETRQAECIAVETFPLKSLQSGGGAFKMTAIAEPETRYALVGTITNQTEAKASGLSLGVNGQAATAEYKEALIAARETIFGQGSLFPGLYELRRSEPLLAEPVSQACTVPQFDEAIYRHWLGALHRPMHRHRKQWEFIYILQALEYYGALRLGARGLGFGVGEEPLPALMAARGCRVTATDLPMDDTRVADWSGSGQHSSSLAGLSQPTLIPDEALVRSVEFRPVDMTRIPDDLTDYDFTWSSCALEHVGSIALGLDFIERSIACLKPGGIAVHTTELNLLSNDATIDHSGTVLFRRRDFEEITARLVLQGHEVMPLNFIAGSTPLDDHIDVPPYSSNEHFKLLMSRYLTTSFGLIVRRGAK